MLTQEEKKSFNASLLRLGAPMALQNLLTASLSLIDTIMIGQLGDIEIAAVGFANQMFFLINLITWGFISGASVLMTQYYGSNNPRGFQRAQALSLVCSLFFTSVVGALSVFTPELLMRIFTPDEAVIAAGSEYLRYVGVSYVFFSLAYVFQVSLRSVGNTATGMKISAVSVAVDVVFNYLLIFGKFGFPRLGVAGAAIATALARLVEMVLLLVWVYRRKPMCALTFRLGFSFDRAFLGKFAKTVLPVAVNEVGWALGMMAYKMVYGRMGLTASAAAAVAESIQNLFWVVTFGLGNALGIIIGHTIGEKHDAVKAQDYAMAGIRYNLITGFVLWALMSAASFFMPALFGVSEEVFSTTTRALLVMAALMPLNFVNMAIVCGILRAGGDTKTSARLELSAVWIAGVPLTFLGGLVLGLPLWGVILLQSGEALWKFTWGVLRVRGGRWINDLTYD